MIVELRDIIEGGVIVAHSPAPPLNTTLGSIFDSDKKLAEISSCIVQVRYNGTRVDDWRNIVPEGKDRIAIDIAPKGWAIAGVIAAIITAVASVAQFILSMVNRPKPVKSDLGSESPTYNFDGIRTSYAPGLPVPVIYGERATGGQLLQLVIDDPELVVQIVHHVMPDMARKLEEEIKASGIK